MSSCAQKNRATVQQFEVNKTETEWKKILTPEQYAVLRDKATERPFTGALLKNKEDGTYRCAACNYPLFTSDAKFESNCGWPSFDGEIEGHVIKQDDNSLGMHRTEILCARCGSHLGHLFDDGPTETGLRYCVNSLSLGFEGADAIQSNMANAIQLDTITMAGGCFWCMEAVFEELKGVTSVISGYAGGEAKDASYYTVSDGNTGHAEAIQVVFDSSVITLAEVFKVFFTMHDPTTLNRQGADQGSQYRSAIFYRNETQQKTANELIAAFTKEKVYDNPIVTEVVKYDGFYKAEEYHQDYFANNKNQPYCRAVIQPKMEKFEKIFKDLKKDEINK
ncbi:MAG: bifunctional methionine sulfoxide reductase B/A protein [Bacteroidetes bacterium]|nr:bifunctional methionine sulfoxide reductase B/A protein [Bacteroidota bacterium]